MVVVVSGLKSKCMFNWFSKKKVADPEKELAAWIAAGKPAPPPHIVKQRAILRYRDSFNSRVLVETGTYLGDMVEAHKKNFEKIFSIELSEKLFGRAQKRFRNQPGIILLQGDSGKKLAEVLGQLQEPALFWLDGHYSGGITAKADKECPVPEELHTIFSSPYPHIVLIDDARLFNGTHDYPAMDEIKVIIESHSKNYQIEIADDIIRLTPIN
jgi:hypothetical protein